MSLTDVHIAPLDPERFRAILTERQVAELDETIARARVLLPGIVVWNISSTAQGGGVAEMLRSLLAYARGTGVDARWGVIKGNDEFFRLTKRIHNRLHGAAGDEGPLGGAERDVYETVLQMNAGDLLEVVKPGDIVLLHDPQTAGLVRAIKDVGARVVWRCHVGIDEPNDFARSAWEWLMPYIADADAYVFSRRAHAWEGLEPGKLVIVPPSIDAFSTKNQALDPATAHAILHAAGLWSDNGDGQPVFVREDGTPGRVDRRADVVEGRPLRDGDRIVTQVSRWDRLKDPVGVMEGFVEAVTPRSDAHLVLAGPAVAGVTDDPEGAEVLWQVTSSWSRLPVELRERIHIASLPMQDAEENAAIVNALQRRSDVIVQKSLAEGFGLTVAEGMWKGRPVVASRVGGIQDQIVDGVTGFLIDPGDRAAFGEAVVRILSDPEAAARVGAEARIRVRDWFLGPRHLRQYVDLFERLIEAGA